VDGPQEAIVEWIKEVGRYFLLYEIQKVGIISIGCEQTTQLAVPLILHPLAFISWQSLSWQISHATQLGLTPEEAKEVHQRCLCAQEEIQREMQQKDQVTCEWRIKWD
jgi:hypothetical protein